VLLKNCNGVLPLDRSKLRSIAIIGPHADRSMISGGGSAQVDPPGEPAAEWQEEVWFPTSPLRAVQAKAPSAKVQFDSGANPASAAALAATAEVAIVFVYQWTTEGLDLPNLSLPANQDALIEQVAAANPRTIVVLETGTAVTMPWLDKISAVVEAWYAGSKGADAVASVLFGDVNPGAKLPMTFPRSEADLPHPRIVMPPPQANPTEADHHTTLTKPTFDIYYDEGLKVGYKWYDAENKPVLFPFGFGLSYTTYRYSDLKVKSNGETTVSFTVKNTGPRAGAETAEVYAALPASSGEPPKRLVGWSKLHLDSGESREVSITIDPLYLSIFDETVDGWKLLPGSYTFMVGGSSQDLPLVKKAYMK
jgi:beta-glucosidase